MPLSQMVSEEIALQFAVTHGRIDGRELVNIEIDIYAVTEGAGGNLNQLDIMDT